MPSILYLGTEQGVVTLKSDNGRDWKVENHALKNWAVPEVAVSPGSPNKVFAGTRGDGVWMSEDFGATWKKPCYGNRARAKFVVSPSILATRRHSTPGLSRSMFLSAGT